MMETFNLAMAFKLVLSAAAFFGGLWVRDLQAQIKDLHAEIKAVTAQLSGRISKDDYVREQREMREELRELGRKMDRLVDKLDAKADKT